MVAQSLGFVKASDEDVALIQLHDHIDFNATSLSLIRLYEGEEDK
jgi:hypothetical protein